MAAERIYDSSYASGEKPPKTENKPSPKGKNKEEFFGVEYKDLKGEKAIEKLLQEKQGHVKAAFYRKEIGDLDLVWGDENGGLAHVLKRRDEMKAKGTGTISGIDMVRKIPEIVELGDFVIDDLERIKFEYNGYRVGISPTFYGEKLNWIVTAMEILNK